MNAAMEDKRVSPKKAYVQPVLARLAKLSDITEQGPTTGESPG